MQLHPANSGPSDEEWRNASEIHLHKKNAITDKQTQVSVSLIQHSIKMNQTCMHYGKRFFSLSSTNLLSFLLFQKHTGVKVKYVLLI